MWWTCSSDSRYQRLWTLQQVLSLQDSQSGAWYLQEEWHASTLTRLKPKVDSNDRAAPSPIIPYRAAYEVAHLADDSSTTQTSGTGADGTSEKRVFSVEPKIVQILARPPYPESASIWL